MGARRVIMPVAYAATAVFVAAGLLGLVGDDALLVVPALLALWPLLCGRHPGETQLARLATRFQARDHASRRAPGSAPLRRARPSAVALPRGGRLLARRLAVRPPPRRAAAI